MLPRKLQEILPQLNGAIMLVNTQCKIAFWSEGAKNLLGYSTKEAVGRSCYELLEGEDRFGNPYCSPSCPIAQINQNDRPIQPFELYVRTKEKKRASLFCSVLTFRGKKPEQNMLLFQLHELKMPTSGPIFFQSTAAPATKQAAASPPRPKQTSPSSGEPSQANENNVPPWFWEGRDNKPYLISRREREVLSLLAQGHNTVAIGKLLKISPTTVRNHIQNLLQKLGVHSRLEAIIYAFRNRLI